MKCSDFQHQIEQALDAHGPTAEESAAFLDHVQQCGNSTCTALWSEHQQFADALDQWRQSVPQVDLADRVVSELRESTNTSGENQQLPARLEATYASVRLPPVVQRQVSPDKPAPRGHIWGIAATVVAVLVLVSLVVLRPAGEAPVVNREQQSIADLVEAVSDAIRTGDQQDLPSADVIESYATMPLSATEFVTDAVALVVPADLTDPAEEPSRADLWADQLEEQWEPIGKELGSTFDVLWEAIPESPPSST